MASTKEKKTTSEIPLLRIVSLGCAKNFVDTEVAAGSLICAGFGLTALDDDADLIFINTCAFLKMAREEAEEEIRYAEKWKSKAPKRRKIIVAGCIVEWDRDGKFRALHPAVDAWTGIDAVASIGEVVRRVWSGDNAVGATNGSQKQYLYDHETPRLQLTAPHYAYLKIADGCDNCCTYCKIPSIRGSLRSRTVSDVVEEARGLLSNGVKELIVIAQDTSAFGRDQADGKPHLAELLTRLDELEGDYYIRLMYLHPASVTPELLLALKQCKHLIPCLEMPLQHISEPVLKAMHRRISEADTRALIKTMKQELGFALRTTFMVGFPGETEEDFLKLKEFVRETEFTRMGVFVYSREEGVPAASLDHQVPAKTAERRMGELMELQAEISEKANRALIGKTIPVMIDGMDSKTRGFGRTLLDAPDIDNQVIISGASGAKEGDLVNVKIHSATEYEMEGRLAADSASPAKHSNPKGRKQ